MRPKVQLVTAVWGRAYIKGFLNRSLLTFLASGNLPALAAETELEYVILTARKDARVFEAAPQFARLKALATVRFLFIDDLIVPRIYGVVLTLAYFRAIQSMGEKARDTFFVFMNSDFLLADGSLRSLLPYFRKGAHVVLAPSFRAKEETVLPEIMDSFDNEQQLLAIPPREMVGMALRNPHPTVAAKTFNQTALRSAYPNNLYWRVDNTATLGHYFLLFMLVIRPQRLPRKATGFCDYTFVPEFCPDAEADVITDSDDFFMLEMQEGEYEAQYITPGRNSASGASASLKDWTTAEHRRYSRHTLVFHSADLPANLETERERFDETLKQIHGELAAFPPRSHADHYYWHGAVAAWAREKGTFSIRSDANVLNSFHSSLSSEGFRGRHGSLAAAIANGLETHLQLSQFQMNSTTSRKSGLARFLREAVDRGQLLYVGDDYYLDMFLMPHASRVDKVFSFSMLSTSEDDAKPYNSAVCVLTPQNLSLAERIMPRILDRLAVGGELFILYRRDTALSSAFKGMALDSYSLERLCHIPLADKRLWWTTAPRIVSQLMRLFARCVLQARHFSVRAMVGGIILSPVVFFFPLLPWRGRSDLRLPYDVMTLFLRGRKMPASPEE